MNDKSIKCPKCGSTQIHVHERGFKTGRAIAGGLLTGNILVAAAAGAVGKNKIELVCLKCGHKFKIGEAHSTYLNSTDQDRKFEKLVAYEREPTAMYKCDCGKESCLPISAPICPKCGRKLNDTKKFVPIVPKLSNSGCLVLIFIQIIITILLAYEYIT